MSDEYTPTTEDIRSSYRISDNDKVTHPGLAWDRIITAEGLDRWLTAHDAATRTAALEEAAVIVENCLLIPDSETEAYNEAVADVISALRAAKVVEHEHDPGGCTCGCPVSDCADCGG